MKTINLANLEQSEIKYKISRFPDGQQNIEITYLESIQPILIKSRMNNWKDLELIACTVACLRRMGIREIHLYSPYILGARSDRKFVEGGNSYLVDIVAPFIKSLRFRTVVCMDVHSDVAAACITNLEVYDNKELFVFAINDIYGVKDGWIYAKPLDNCTLVSPDAGSLKKIHKLADAVGYKNDIVVCSKSRDVEGHLTNTIVPLTGEKGKDFVIIDDICDGGRTFINIAVEIKKTFANANIYLIVTHGIFSAKNEQGIPVPFNELVKYFAGIYCTNSVQDIYDVWNDGYRNRPTRTKQLKVI